MQSSVAAAFVWYLSDGLISFLEAQVQLAVDRSSFRYFLFLKKSYRTLSESTSLEKLGTLEET